MILKNVHNKNNKNKKKKKKFLTKGRLGVTEITKKNSYQPRVSVKGNSNSRDKKID